MVYNPNHVVVGAGSLYVAPLGTTEPTSVTGAWPSGWSTLGYTDQGSEFASTTTWAQVMVEEEFYPIRNAPTEAKVTLTFALAEATAVNLQFALNGGMGSWGNATTTGVNADGSVWVEPPIVGQELRCMVGWDSLVEGAAQPPSAAVGQLGAFGRLLVRQVIQTGSIKRTARKGNNKAMWSCEFSGEKPATGLQPFRFIFPAGFAS